MIGAHTTLTLQAAHVAASALRAIESLRPLLGPPNGEVTGFEGVLDALQALYRPPKPKRPRPKRPPKPRVPRLHTKARRQPLPEREEELDAALDERESPWDPEPLYEASRCQALLMEIIRRAAHDYVLYRQHHRLELKALAEQAYIWLFEEEPGHPAWKSRERALFQVTEGGQALVEVGSRRLTSFLSICETCGLDPEAVRQRAREMTVESIMHTGRHIERRRAQKGGESLSIETHSVVVDVDMDSLEAEAQGGFGGDYYDSRESYGIDHAW